MDDAGVTAYDFTVRCYKIPRREFSAGVVFDKPGVVLIRHETDLLAVRFGGYPKPDLPGDIADLIFGVFAYRHQRVGELLLGQICRLYTSRCV